jgi:hypothetical protein
LQLAKGGFELCKEKKLEGFFVRLASRFLIMSRTASGRTIIAWSLGVVAFWPHRLTREFLFKATASGEGVERNFNSLSVLMVAVKNSNASLQIGINL